MKKRLLFLALWAVTLTGAMGQAWEQGVPSGSFINTTSAAYHPNYGLFFGGGKGQVWRVNNGIIDTLFSSPTLQWYQTVNTMAFSGDTLLFNSPNYGLQKMKIGDAATHFLVPNSGPTNCIATKANKRWFAGTNGLFYYDGANYYHDTLFNSNTKYLAVNNSNVAFIVQNDSLMSVYNNQYTLITNTIDSINCLKVNPVTDDLYFSTPSHLYKLSGNSIIQIDVTTSIIDFSNNSNFKIKFFSFSSTDDRIFILYKSYGSSVTSSIDLLVTGINNEYILIDGPIEEDTLAHLVLPIFEANNRLIFTTTDHYYQLDNSVISSDMLSYNVIDKGNFRALINSDGVLFKNKSLHLPLFEFPKFSSKKHGVLFFPLAGRN